MVRKSLLVLVVLALLWGVVFSQSKSTTPLLLSDPILREQAWRYADQQLSQLTLEEQVAQLIMPMIYPKNDGATTNRLRRLYHQKKFGGILWQKGSPEAQLALTQEIQQGAPVPVLVAMDGEWGLSMRLTGTIQWPRAIVLGATGDEQLAERYGAATAKEAKRMGIHVNFAPVADVNSNPRNPVIGTRSFGSNPTQVALLSTAYAKGLEQSGVLSVVKHFPGHGDTDKDSHKTLPVIHKSRAEMEGVELRPFRHYIIAGLGGVMTGHLSIPSLDASGRAASASKAVVTDLLQKELGFEGLIFTDGLGMQGILEGTGGKSVAVEVFKAGNDILLAPNNPEQALQEIISAIELGEITKEEVARRCRKVLVWKYALKLPERDLPPLTNLSQDLNSADAKALLQEIFRKAITLAKHEGGTLPISGDKKVALLRYGNSRTPHLLSQLRKHAPTVTSFTINNGASQSERQSVYRQLAQYDVVLVAVTSQSSRPDNGLVQLAKGTPILLSFLTSPYTANHFTSAIKEAKGVLFAYETKPEAQIALADAVMGRATISGRLPVALQQFEEGTSITLEERKATAGLPKVSPEQVGLSSQLTQKIDAIAEEGVAKGAYPGCQVLVAKDGKIVHSKAYGYKDVAKREPNSTETLYDLASITKAVVTTPLIMMAEDRGLLKTGDRIGNHLSFLKGSDKEQIRISDLLFHTAGLPAVIRFYFSMIDKDSYTSPLMVYSPRAGFPVQIDRKAWVQKSFDYLPEMVSKDSSALYPHRFAEGLYLSDKVREMMREEIKGANRRTRGYRYSDIDFLLLQEILEERSGKSLDQLFNDEIATPLGTKRMLFKPYQRYATSEIAEGTKDGFLRKQTLRGDVDDEAAAMLGGVAGNAGLYSNAEDLAILLQMLLNGGFYDGKRYIERHTVERFTTAKHPTSPYALGFDRHRGKGKRGNCADEAPTSTYGHTGFTGTAFWVDPTNDIIFIFLSNRGAPKRWNGKLSSLDIRKRIQRAIYESL